MAKGQFLKVTYRTGVGTDSVEIVARTDGQVVVWSVPKDRDRFLEVKVEGRTGKTASTYMFAAADVVAIVEGHKTASELTSKTRRVRVAKALDVHVDEPADEQA